ncbi:PepSY-associated TM helix domain-containing protein [Flavobacterium turcicum]|uniref:PepSY domain-containing protein n=1 Tax=Flavobacterium turcicum TaxID=2764718 RepID=A0ABR7JHF0_9FLAO|nr:PepSY-associated TM helix domain-containing protein [Flavobacterium turcicum]MBC5863923.1 PepSY domain-containing protein [Flavobacterium turcicum]NHL02689.1 PepSY domain-containing protein [Flavobacterium turcicum]
MKKENQKTSTRKKDSKWIKKIKQHVYSWHRTLAIITIVPVIFWTLSGIMHPFMAHFFKPEIANQELPQTAINQSRLPLPLKEVLQKNQLKTFKNFRLVSLNDKTYYQVKTESGALLYFDAATAQKLENGDQKYAEVLARYFLQDSTSSISNSKVLTEFTTQYKYVNRYLPVYQLSFDRADEMQVYVETASSKLATFNPKSRQIFIWFFDTFHNWSFIDAISNNSLRIIIMIVLLSVISFSAISGLLIYGLFWKQFKKSDALAPKKGIRRYHRQIGIWISLFTLTFAFSGAYHATTKWDPYTLSQMVYEPSFKTEVLTTSLSDLKLDWSRFENASVVAFQDSLYYRCQMLPKQVTKTNTAISAPESKWAKKDKQPLEIVYINAQTNRISANLDVKYAEFLAHYFTDGAPKAACCEMIPETDEPETSLKSAKLVETKIINEFESREYGFVNKRLPVVKLAYDTPENTTYFIETATSRLAAKVENADKREGYSFAIFHKFLFLDWAGKNIRDAAMVLTALAILIVSVLGLILFLKKK